MCARFSLYATPAQIAELLDIEVPETLPRYNIAPSQMLLGAIERDGKRELREFKWGLIPSWAKDASVGSKMINARAETLLERPAFRTAFERRRCVIPANGFFEWKHEMVEEPVAAATGPSLFEEHDIPRGKTKKRMVKRPFLLALKSGEPFAFAGLYDYWRDPTGDLIRSCTILTTEPNELVAPLHDRMPVILRKADLHAWLEDDPMSVLHPLPSGEMISRPVSTLVNDPNNECPEVLAGM